METEVLGNRCPCGSRIKDRKIYCDSCAKVQRAKNNRLYRIRNKEKINELNKHRWRYDPLYRERLSVSHKKWAEKNKIKVRSLSLKHSRMRYSTPEGKISTCISSNIRKSIMRGKDGKHWESLVGYTKKDLMRHLSEKFKTGMTWDNYGKVWHIDHIIPISAFNIKSYEDYDFKRCWSIDNLQPLFAFDNKSKGGKVEAPFQPSLL